MIQEIFVVLGTVMFTDALFEKWNVWELLSKIAMRSKQKFFFLLLLCKFCMMFHLSWMLTVVYGLFGGFSPTLFVVPVVVSGLIHLKSK